MGRCLWERKELESRGVVVPSVSLSDMRACVLCHTRRNEKYGVPADFVQRVYDKTRGRGDEFVDEVYGVAAVYGEQVSVDHRLFLRSLQGDKLCVGAGEGAGKAAGKDEL